MMLQVYVAYAGLQGPLAMEIVYYWVLIEAPIQ